jgi:hypothetical protein
VAPLQRTPAPFSAGLEAHRSPLSSRPCINPRHDRQAGYQSVTEIIGVVDGNFYGHALYDFREVAGGIVGREEGKL